MLKKLNPDVHREGLSSAKWARLCFGIPMSIGSGFDTNSATISRHLIVGEDWSPEHFTKMRKVLESRCTSGDSRAGDLKGLSRSTSGVRQPRSVSVLRLLENPNLLEHDYFTELLWAVFHLAEELSHREKVTDLPDTDYEHLSGPELASGYEGSIGY